MKLKLFTATGRCVSGGSGWGETGQVQSIGHIAAKDIKEALLVAKRVFPGGWRIIAVREDNG